MKGYARNGCGLGRAGEGKRERRKSRAETLTPENRRRIAGVRDLSLDAKQRKRNEEDDPD